MQVNNFNPEMYNLNAIKKTNKPKQTNTQPTSSDQVTFNGKIPRETIEKAGIAATFLAVLSIPVSQFYFKFANPPQYFENKVTQNVAEALKDIKNEGIYLGNVTTEDTNGDGALEIIAKNNDKQIVYDITKNDKTVKYIDKDGNLKEDKSSIKTDYFAFFKWIRRISLTY